MLSCLIILGNLRIYISVVVTGCLHNLWNVVWLTTLSPGTLLNGLLIFLLLVERWQLLLLVRDLLLWG